MRSAAAAPGQELGRELDRAAVWERRRALRALLQQPLLTADGPRGAELVLVRRHAPWLRDWLAHHAGWRLQVDAELARLRKIPAESRLGDGSRPAREPRAGTPFSRRRYVLLCLALAALERSDRQTALGRLAEQILAFAAGDAALEAAGIRFDLEGRDQRRDLVQVVRFLLELRVLVRVQGDEQQFLEQRGDVLYTIRRPALAALLSVRRAPSTVVGETMEERIAGLLEEALPDTDEGRNRRLRLRLTRRLLDDPVLYYEDLDEAERAYLTSQRSHLLRWLHEATGLIPEVRREGIALVDERGDLTDLGLPEEGTDGHLTLLLAEYLASHARRRLAEGGTAAVSVAALESHTAGLIREHKGHWRKDVREPGAEVALTERTLERLEALDLVERTADGVVPLPAIGRYALQAAEKREESA